MKVLYIAAECKPFSKVGGVGDVAGELPPELKRQGVDIEIVTPLYSQVERKHVRAKTRELTVAFNGNNEPVDVHGGEVDGVPVHFIRNHRYFEEGSYGAPYVTSKVVPFWDDVLRFSFFSYACLALVRQLEPDVVHVNDWGPSFLFGLMFLEKMPQKRVLTVHNVGYQGNIGKESIQDWQIAEILKNRALSGLFSDPHPEWNSVNPLRLGLELSHKANTVSPTYCREMTEPEDQGRFFEGGRGLHEVAGRLVAEGRLTGILNGFAYSFEPTDAKFEETLRAKESMKADISAEFSDPTRPLLGFVGRAVEQKFRLLAEKLNGRTVLEHILDIGKFNLVFLATGQKEYEELLKRLSGRSDFKATIKNDSEMAKTISLGSDFFLMPSVYEPCGITQMESMSNATPPLVRWTGGLVDTVRPHTDRRGTGIGFDGTDREGVLRSLPDAVEDAWQVANDAGEMRRLQRNGFNERFLWRPAAKRYIEELYR